MWPPQPLPTDAGTLPVLHATFPFGKCVENEH